MMRLGLGLGLSGRQAAAVVAGGYDWTFGGSLLPVRHHVASSVTTAGTTMTLPNEIDLGGATPPAYVQAVTAHWPLVETTNGVDWLSSPFGLANPLYFTTPSSADVAGTDIFALVRRLGNNTVGFIMGRQNFNSRVGFFINYVRFTNIYGAQTGDVAITSADGWFVVHLHFMQEAVGSYFRAYTLGGTLIDEITSDNIVASAVQDMLLGSSTGSIIEASDAGLRRLLVYSHDGGIPTTEQANAIMAEMAVDGLTMEAA